MSLQQAVSEAGDASASEPAPAPASNAGTPLSPSDPSESKRRRTELADARADAAADLEEAIRRSLEPDPGLNPGGGAPASGSRSGATSGAGPSNPFATLFDANAANAANANAPPPPPPAVDAAALARAFAAASAFASGGAPPGNSAPNVPGGGPAGEVPSGSGGASKADAGRSISNGGAASRPPPSRPPLPPADEWWLDADAAARRAAARESVEVGASVEWACAALSDAFGGIPVVPFGAAAPRGAEADRNADRRPPIRVAFAGGSGSGSLTLSAKVLDAAVASFAGRCAPRRAIAELGACHRRARSAAETRAAETKSAASSADPAAEKASDPFVSLHSSLAFSVARWVHAKLAEEDGDDLYFDGGQHKGDFVDALARDEASIALLEDALDAAATESDAAAWRETLRRAFRGVAEEPLDQVEGLAAPSARALGRLLEPPRLVRAFAEELRREAEATYVLFSGGDGERDARVGGRGGAFARSAPSLGSRDAEHPERGAVLGPVLARSAFPMLLRGGSSGSRRNARSKQKGTGTILCPSLDSPGCAGGDAGPELFASSLRRYPRCPPGDRERLQVLVQRAASTTHDVAHGAMMRCVRRKGAGMESALAWVCGAISACERKPGDGAGAGAHVHRGDAFADPREHTDGFRVGVAAVALRFARPVAANAGRLVGERLMDLAPLRENWRFDWAAEPNLARVRRDGSSSVSVSVSVSGGDLEEKTSLRATTPPSFAAETFFAATRAFHHALLPAVRRFEEAARVLADRARRKGHQQDGGDGSNDGSNGEQNDASGGLASDVEFHAFSDCASSALLDPELAGDACGLALLQAHWLQRLATLEDADPDAALEAFGAVPERIVRGIAEWVRFVLRHGKAELFLRTPAGSGAGLAASSPNKGTHKGAALSPGPPSPLTVDVLARFACELLSRPRLVRHPVPKAALVEMLQYLLLGEGFSGQQGGGLGVRGSATHELLVSSVLGSSEARRSLCPALIRAYATLDAVEGLDVDRDDFDKFHTRDVIARVLMELWNWDECVASVAELGRVDRDAFADFAGCVLGDLMYVLQDSLDRLTSIAEIQAEREDERAWNALDSARREEKERFFRGQERAATGFLRDAKTTLRLLNVLAGSRDVAPAFLTPKVAPKAAYAAVHFLEVLLGPKAEALASVKDPKKYGFDKEKLVEAVAEFVARLQLSSSRAGGAAQADDSGTNVRPFAAALAEEADYDGATLERARDLLVRRTIGAAFVPPVLRDVVDACAALRGEGAPTSDFASDEEKKNGSPGSQAPDPAAHSDSLASLVESLGPDPHEGSESAAASAYKSAFSRLTFGESDDAAPFVDFFPPFLAQSASDDASGASGSRKRAKRLAREFGAVAENGSLPCELGSSIFLRHEPDRLDRMRAAIVGPEGTPYACGAFVFDLYFPGDYPAVPPMLNLDTTGGGRARFNPNLYADGKVCLSLLGTWHGGGAEEKWDAERSTAAQALVSVQGLILVDDPMFNEPGFDGLRGTPEGARKSAAYNEEIRLNTVRYAMIEHLRKPRAGVGRTIEAHFFHRRHATMRTVKAWCEECEDPTVAKRMRDAARELAKLLAENAKKFG